VAGVPEFGVEAAARAGAEPGRLLLVPDPGAGWPQVAAALLDGCEVVAVRPPVQPSVQVRQRLGAVLRRGAGVLLVIGEWDGAPVRLRVARQRWTGLGDGHGRLRACRAEVVAEGRGAARRPRREWLWLPAPDGTVAAAGPEETMPGQPPVADGWPGELAGRARLDAGPHNRLAGQLPAGRDVPRDEAGW
jgi:hypothetical protein